MLGTYLTTVGLQVRHTPELSGSDALTCFASALNRCVRGCDVLVWYVSMLIPLLCMGANCWFGMC